MAVVVLQTKKNNKVAYDAFITILAINTSNSIAETERKIAAYAEE